MILVFYDFMQDEWSEQSMKLYTCAFFYKNSLISESADNFLSLCSKSTPDNTGTKNWLKRQKVYLV